MRIAVAGLAVLLSACAVPLKLIDARGGTHPGEYDSMAQTVKATVDGKLFTGHYITNQSVGFYQGSGMTFSGSRVGSTSMTGTAYHAGDSGRAILTAQDGAVLTCSFNYDSIKVIGECQSNTGDRYHLISQ